MRTESYLCQRCGATATREVKRGTRPKWCMGCRSVAYHCDQAKQCVDCGRTGLHRDPRVVRCSDCTQFRRGPTFCKVPKDHPSRQRIVRGLSRRVFITDCAVCGRCFATPYTVTTCSSTCAEAKRLSDRRESKHRHRARKRGAFVAPVSRIRVYERDRWTCHLCGTKVSRDRVVPHPRAPVLDHVVPLAVGGSHEPANVRTAHFLCNSRKGSRGGGEQLALIG